MLEQPGGPRAAAASKPAEADSQKGHAAPVAPAAIGSRSRPEAVLNALGKPAAVLVISGEQDGYLEPCGCSEDQEGGLIRRYDLVERIAQAELADRAGGPGQPDQKPRRRARRVRAGEVQVRLCHQGLEAAQLQRGRLSAEDLKVGVAEALGLFDNSLGGTTKIVVANVEAAAIFAKVFQPSVIVSVGPVKLGVTAVIDPDLLQSLNDPDKQVFLPQVQAPEKVLPAVLADLEAKSDYQVLMVQGPPELAERLAKAFPGFDVVVATSRADDVLNRDAEMLNDGKTMLVTVGKKGKNVGLIGVYPDGAPRLRFLLVTLNKQFDGPAAPMKSLVQDDYRGMLKAADVVGNFSRHDSVTGATFVGARTCRECHPNTYQFWSTTKHAQAFESLKHDPKPNTIFDAECVSCHTTGFEYNSGWRSQAATPHLGGNQCENCHGPGSRHVANPDDAELRKPITLKAEQAKTNGLCERCHDAENSRNFDFAIYWGKVVHKNLDEYKDPKVHVGIKPKAPVSKPLEKPH